MAIDTRELVEYVSLERGEIHRRIFSDPDIYDLEMELIFGRAWLFLAHETMIPRAGDFFEAPMGRDTVLIVRQRDGGLKALLNTCTHRGNAVCRAEEGNTKNFMCTYHGWTFDLAGKLIGVPGFENLYHGDLDKDSLGFREVAQLDSYKGFVFATMDPSAPCLHEYLGATGRLGLDFIAERGEMEIIPGIQKYVIDCNWKFAVDNLFDWYHPQITHMSAFGAGIMPGARRPDPDQPADRSQVIDRGGTLKSDGTNLELPDNPSLFPSNTVIGEYGHAIGGPTVESSIKMGNAAQLEWRKRPEAVAAMGEVGVKVGGHPNIFPNSWITNTQLWLRVPRAANSTELWAFSFVEKDAPEDQRRDRVFRVNHVFGPAGFLEQEDGENWSQSTRQTTGLFSQQIPQMLKMDLGRGKVVKEGGLARIDGVTTEHPQLWTYGAWAQYMSGADWDTIRANTTPGDYM